MLNLGKVKPGSTIYIPFDSFAGATGASITLTGLLASDIEIYKDGSMTQRGSDNGYTLLDTDGIDLDGITGIHGVSISLADNTTAGFYAAGSRYWVVISSVTIDTQTVNFIAATFEIEVEGAVLSTTIATLASQTSFTLTNGPAEDDALNGCVCYIHDVASAVQGGFAIVQDYTGSTKTVTLEAGTTFTAAATDNVGFFPPGNMHSLSGSVSAAAVLKAWAATDVSGTADSGTTTTMVDAARTEADTDYWKDSEILFTSGTIAGQQRLITGFDPATDTITFHPATTQAVGTNTYIIIGGARKDVGMLNGSRTDQNAATLSLLQLNCVNSGGSAIVASATGGNGHGIAASGNGSGEGISGTGGATGSGIQGTGGATSGQGILGIGGAGGGIGIAGQGTGANSGITGTSGTGATGDGIRGQSLATNGNGLAGIGNGTGVDLAADNLPGSAAVIADAVWDEALAGHAGAGSAGEALSAAGTAGDPWTTALPGAYGAGTAGNIVGNNIPAILVDTGTTLDGRIPAALVGGRMDANVGAMAANVLTAAAAAPDLTTELQSGLATAAALAAVQADLPARLVKNTAFPDFKFYMVTAADAKLPATGMTVTAERCIDAAASFSACANAVEELEEGWYKIDLAAADLNGDDIAFKFTATGAVQTGAHVITQPT